MQNRLPGSSTLLDVSLGQPRNATASEISEISEAAGRVSAQDGFYYAIVHSR